MQISILHIATYSEITITQINLAKKSFTDKRRQQIKRVRL